MRPLDRVKSGHERLFFIGSPWPARRGQAFTPGRVGGLGNSRLASLLVQGRGRHGLVRRQNLPARPHGSYRARVLGV